MASSPTPIIPPAIPEAMHRGAEDLPFVRFTDGVEFQLLQVDIELGLWVVRTIFEPGVTVQTHKHTGEVYAVTFSGAWKYVEYPETVNRAHSYLFEPAGSVHTLTTAIDGVTEPTDVWFAIRGANLNLDENGKVDSVLDAGAILELYEKGCAEAGLPRPDVIRAHA